MAICVTCANSAPPKPLRSLPRPTRRSSRSSGISIRSRACGASSVVQDEPTGVAGGMRGLTPTDYFMVSLGTCQNVIFVRYAALEDRPPDAPRLPHLRPVTQGDRVYDSAHREWAWRALLT